MRYPYINGNAKRRVIIPQLSGGVNLAEAPTYVADNQLTACDNLYFDRGRLRSRPPFEHKGQAPFSPEAYTKAPSSGWMLQHEIGSEDGFANLFAIGENEGTLTFSKGVNGNALDNEYVLTVPFKSSEKEGILIFNSFTVIGRTLVSCTEVTINGDRINTNSREIYIPTLLINNNGSTTPTQCELSGTLFEGFNMLTDSFKTLLTANATSMAWKLPRQPNGGDEIVVELVDPIKGALTHIITLPSNIDRTYEPDFSRYVSRPIAATYLRKDGSACEYLQRVAYDAYTNCIVFVAKDESLDETDFGMHIPPLSIGSYSNSSSNMCVTVRSNSSANATKLLGMTASCWFGGSRGGLGGGTRLFLSGNPKHQGGVYWSDLNNPTYFPENNYAYVGDGTNVNAMAQQSDLLVIFQDNAITASEYVQGETVTASDLTSGAVVDITTLAATFPMTPIHSFIGCDSPDSVQLCANRLVWLKGGSVYTLVSYGQYNERNVRELSYLVSPLLKGHSAASLKRAQSADISGKYCLFVDNKVYVMDYDCPAFKSYTGYSSDRQTQRNVAWYVWTLPDFLGTPVKVFTIGNMAALVNGEGQIYTLSFENKERLPADFDGTARHPISCGFDTKHFVFGAPDRRKNIDSLMLTTDSREGQIKIECLSDGECLAEHLTECCQTADTLNRERIYPQGDNVTDLCIRVKGEGNLWVEDLTIIYKETGDIN